MSIEFSEAERKAFKEAKAYDNLPYGTFKGTLERVESGVFGKKNPMKKLLFVVRVSEPVEHEGFKHTFFVPLTEVPWILKRILKSFEIDENIELEDVESTLIMKEGAELLFRHFENGKGYADTEIKGVQLKESTPGIEPAKPIEIDDDIPF